MKVPNESLKQAWVNLTVWYEPNGVKTMQDVIEQYNNCKREGKDSEEWIIKKDKICLHMQIDYGKRN